MRRDCFWVLLAPGIPRLDSVSHVGEEVPSQCGTGDGGEHEEDRGECGGHGIGRRLGAHILSVHTVPAIALALYFLGDTDQSEPKLTDCQAFQQRPSVHLHGAGVYLVPTLGFSAYFKVPRVNAQD